MIRPDPRTLALAAVGAALVAGVLWVALYRGPLAPVEVTVASIEQASLRRVVLAIGTTDSERWIRIASTTPARIASVPREVGERVDPADVLVVLEPIDLPERERALVAGIAAAGARLDELRVRERQADEEAQRYASLALRQLVSSEAADQRRAQAAAATAARRAAEAELGRIGQERAGLRAQYDTLTLRSPEDARVMARHADPGSVVVAGQPILELMPVDGLRVRVRMDQRLASGIDAGRPARVRLRSRPDTLLQARVLRIEPMADPVTEEFVATLVFDEPPAPFPPVGEMAEAWIEAAPTPVSLVVPTAALQRHEGTQGVWVLDDAGVVFRALQVGLAGTDGRVPAQGAIAVGDRVVVHAASALAPGARVRVRDDPADAMPQP